MTGLIEDYALIGDTHTGALVRRDGSIDWLCLPRFDSAACFAALLGTRDNGRWLIAPEGDITRVERRYRDGTLILETDLHTAEGAVRLIDFMPVRTGEPDLVRMVQGLEGRVAMRMELVIRFDYGSIVPWVRTAGGELLAVAGPDALHLRSPVTWHGEDFRTVASFSVSEGDRVPFVLLWHPSHEPSPPPLDAERALVETEEYWSEWSGRCGYEGEWADAVTRSLITLKAMTYAPTGGIVAAATTSLPERLGGVRNWDYRFCWLRDATFTLYALLMAGYEAEARGWRDWLLRAVAGSPSDLQIVYGPAGERRLTELELDWLPGYEGSAPVRIGNRASRQLQLDVYGEVMDLLHETRRAGLDHDQAAWQLQRALMDFLESGWDQPDEGIWEVRGRKRRFTHSRVMAWLAMDRAVRGVERFGLDGPVERWRAVRGEIHEQVCSRGYDPDLGSFVQYYGSKDVDAALLMIPLVGFLPPTDPRVTGTLAAVERQLMSEGFVARYPTHEHVDGLPPGEGAFLPCTFWYADNLALLGRMEEARAVFERLLAVRNDVGLLSEEYDPEAGRLLGNFPQAFSHVSLVNSVRNLSRGEGPAQHRYRA